MHLICNVVISIIVLYIIYIGLTIIKCNVLTIVKSLGHSDQKWYIATILLEHCDFTVGALQLCDWCIATRLGAFRSWDIYAEGHSDYNPYLYVSRCGMSRHESRFWWACMYLITF